MANLKKYDINGKEIGKVEIDDSLLSATANVQLVKDYIIAIRENARQWSANTKGRSDVNCTGKKPHPQKGTGRARQGSLAAPQYKGGGVVFGPKPKFDVKNCFIFSFLFLKSQHLNISPLLQSTIYVLILQNLLIEKE